MPCILTGILCRRPARPAVAAPQGAATPVRADGGHRRLARGNAPQGAAPLSRHSPTAPLPGEPLGEAAVRKASPARGGVTEGDGGVHCRASLPVSFAGGPQGPPWLHRKALRPLSGPMAGIAAWQGETPRKVPHPSVGIRRQLPFQGSLWGKQPFVKPPLQGEVSPKVTEGCIAAHPYRYPLQDARKARRGCPARRRDPPAVSPETLRSAARGRT